ncbi:MAG: hypothetical protein QM779_17510 [Propionicimonas sp.]|uniref:hypothetical protein n=1 Tax=Propionicimonas sp. TaxID=1955623 RepID=UPI003D0A2ECA
MNRSAPWGAVVVGVGALVLILVRVLQGAWTVPLVVGIGVVGSLGALLLWWLWDRRVFARCIGVVLASDEWDLVLGGYLVDAELQNVGVARPPRGEVVLAAGRPGLRLFDPRRTDAAPVLALRWEDVIDIAPGSGAFLGQTQPGVAVSTMFGRVVLVLRTDEGRGIMSVGTPQTALVIDRLRHLRPNARFE